MGTKEDALAYVKEHKKEIIQACADPTAFPPVKEPETFLMAGSPGAGKTEWSKAFIQAFEDRSGAMRFVRIDPDEMRERIPIYTGSNSDEIQAGAVVAAQKVFDYSLQQRQNILFDGTFANYDLAKQNIERCIKRGRLPVSIVYIHQDPVLAWRVTQAREVREGRTVPKEVFINAYFTAKDNVNQAKASFGDNILLYLIMRDTSKSSFTYKININNVDDYLKFQYTRESLKENLQ